MSNLIKKLAGQNIRSLVQRRHRSSSRELSQLM